MFFYCRNKMKYSWYQDSSCLQSRLALEIGYKVSPCLYRWWMPGGKSHTKVTRMLVVSLWGVNRRFWTHLGCLGGKVIIWFRYRLVLCITKNALTLTTQKSPLAVSLSLSQTYIGLSLGFNLNFPTRFPVTYIWESSPAMNVNSLSCIFVMN